jgi:hypothetical protein
MTEAARWPAAVRAGRSGSDQDPLGVVQDAATGVTKAPRKFVPVDSAFDAVGRRCRCRIWRRCCIRRCDGSETGGQKRRGHNRRAGDVP